MVTVYTVEFVVLFGNGLLVAIVGIKDTPTQQYISKHAEGFPGDPYIYDCCRGASKSEKNTMISPKTFIRNARAM